jgi:hypothetical protein
MKMRIWVEGSCECRAQVPVGEGLIFGEGADRAACHVSANEPRLECLVPIPFAGGGLEIVYVCGDLTNFSIQVDARLCAKLFDEVYEDNLVLYRVGNESSVVLVPLTGKL